MISKKHIPYLFVALALIGTFYFAYRTSSLKKDLKTSTRELEQTKAQVTEGEALLSIDSLLIDGNYAMAMDSYTKTLETNVANERSIQLRIALAQKLIQLQKGDKAIDSLGTVIDTTNYTSVASLGQIQAYDSLNFALEKAKVQIKRMQQQLQNSSNGEYLTFKSAKGNQMHYVGNVSNRMANGEGIALLDTGSRYEGEWKNNKREGEGIFYWPDGEYYEGSYQNDQRNGMGTYHWPNGEKYVGQWQEDKRNGAGTFYGADGKLVTKGIWKNDKLIEKASHKEAKQKR